MIFEQKVEQDFAGKVVRVFNYLLIHFFFGCEYNFFSVWYVHVWSEWIVFVRVQLVFFIDFWRMLSQIFARLNDGIQVFARQKYLVGQVLQEFGCVVAIYWIFFIPKCLI